MRKPKIGIVSNILVMDTGMMPGLLRAYVNQDYIDSLEKSGGIPVMLPVIRNLEDVQEQMRGLDGILLSGGYDIDPALYGENPIWGQGFTMREVDLFYVATIKAADEAGIPVFGICKGLQAINVAFGGTIYQDLKTQLPGSMQHSQQAPRGNATHFVDVTADSFIGSVLEKRTFVNSFHHQAIKEVAEGFQVTAYAEDGVVEGIEHKDGTFICGVQWHPEMMAGFENPAMSMLFQKFVEICKGKKRKNEQQ